MDAIEKAIRGAFERGDPDDPAFRAKVYRSVTAALEKAIVSNTTLSPGMAERRRDGLRATIETVESEFRPAEMGPEPPQPADEASDEPFHDEDAALEPVFIEAPEADPEWHGTVPEVPSIDDFDTPPRLDDAMELREPVIAVREPRRRGRLAAAFIVVTLLAVAGIGAWFAADTGFLKSDAERDTSVPNPPQTLPAETFDPPQEGAEPPARPALAETPRGNWISVFNPADPTTVRAPAEATADLVAAGDRQVIRIRSGTTGAAVLFDVGQGVLEQLRGRKAVFDVTAKSEEGKPTQMSVICNFGELGDCGRKRYAVGVDPGDFLFEIDMPKANPGGAGTIAIVSDVDNAGKAVEIFAIRVSVSGN